MALNNLKVKATIQGQYTGANDIAAPIQDVVKQIALAFTSGVAANQADVLFMDERTLAASATENLDLNGTLLDAFGATFSPAKIKAVLIWAAAANTNDVVVGGAATNGWLGPFGAAAHTVAVKPGGFILMAAPQLAGLGAVTASTGDLLKIANSAAGTGVTYGVIIIGASA